MAKRHHPYAVHFNVQYIKYLFYIQILEISVIQSKKISNDQKLTQSDPLKTKREITEYINWQQLRKAHVVA